MMYCRQFCEENRRRRIGAQLEPGVGAKKQEVASQEGHKEEACGDQNVQVDHLDLRHVNVRTLQEKHFQSKNASND
jgi:hypothetical protein